MGLHHTEGLWWSSDAEAPDNRTDAWQHVLSGSYQACDVTRRVSNDFTARLRQIDLAGIKLVDCVCSPCEGRRLPSHIRRGDSSYLGIQIVAAGAEHFRLGDEAVSLRQGDALIWLSNSAMEFEVTERLHKITLMVPLGLLKERLAPCSTIRTGVVDGQRGFGAVLFSHVLSLGQQADSFHATEVAAARRATLELLPAVFASTVDTRPASLAQMYLRNIQDYIRDHLHEKDLTPARIARANHISVRYLHLLFQPTGQSVSRWISEQRLWRCREILTDPAFAEFKVADIAWKWGFKDGSQFSRAFKARFGQSPRLCRPQSPAYPTAMS